MAVFGIIRSYTLCDLCGVHFCMDWFMDVWILVSALVISATLQPVNSQPLSPDDERPTSRVPSDGGESRTFLRFCHEYAKSVYIVVL